MRPLALSRRKRDVALSLLISAMNGARYALALWHQRRDQAALWCRRLRMPGVAVTIMLNFILFQLLSARIGRAHV